MSSDNVYVFQQYLCRDNNTIPSILVIFRSSIEVEEVPQIPDLILILTIKAMLYLGDSYAISGKGDSYAISGRGILTLKEARIQKKTKIKR